MSDSLNELCLDSGNRNYTAENIEKSSGSPDYNYSDYIRSDNRSGYDFNSASFTYSRAYQGTDKVYPPGNIKQIKPNLKSGLKFWNIRVIAVVLVIMSLMGFFLFLTQNTTTKKQAQASDIFTPEQVVNTVNKERRKVGLPSLTTNQKLMKSAQNKAIDMNKNDYFAHISPRDGKKWSDFIKEADYEYLVAGENLAKGFDDVEAMVDAWMNSPAHKENIVSQKVDETGVGIYKGTLKGRETVFVVQVFGKQMSEEEKNIFMKDESKEK